MTASADIRRLIAVIILLMITAVSARPALAQGGAGNAEQLVKAAYLFHFCGLVDWPESSFRTPQSPLKVGILGNDALADELTRLVASRPPQRRPIVVIKSPPIAERNSVHLLYVDDKFRGQLQMISSALKGQPVLTVTNSEQALKFGSIINFLSVDGALRFEISADAATEANLAISSRLLAVSYRLAPGSPKFRLD